MWGEMPGLISSDNEDNKSGGDSPNTTGNHEDVEYEVVHSIPPPPKKPVEVDPQTSELEPQELNRIFADQMRVYRKEKRAYKRLCNENGWDLV